MPDPNLKDTVHAQMIASMKSANKARTQVLRMLLSEIKAREADDINANPNEAVANYAKKLRKTMAEMEKLNQPTHAQAIKAELIIVDEFLPKQIDDAALDALLSQTLSTMGPLTPKDMGRAIGAVMKAVAAAGSSADAAKVRQRVECRLTGQ